MRQLLLQNRDESFLQPSIAIKDLEIISTRVHDLKFFDFIKVCNGGFFFNRALHLYGICKEPLYHSMSYVNEIIVHEYREFADDLTFFGQDIFGNQFAFSPKGVVMFNLETADTEMLAKDFNEWTNVLAGDLDYLTGRTLLKTWEKKGRLLYDQRLCAKKPFVIGGEYRVENLYSSLFPTYLSSNANIARQIHDLPEGSEIVLKITE
jgi:hypothetical protein